MAAITVGSFKVGLSHVSLRGALSRVSEGALSRVSLRGGGSFSCVFEGGSFSCVFEGGWGSSLLGTILILL